MVKEGVAYILADWLSSRQLEGLRPIAIHRKYRHVHFLHERKCPGEMGHPPGGVLAQRGAFRQREYARVLRVIFPLYVSPSGYAVGLQVVIAHLQ